MDEKLFKILTDGVKENCKHNWVKTDSPDPIDDNTHHCTKCYLMRFGTDKYRYKKS